MSSPDESEIIKEFQRSLGGRFTPEDVESFCVSGKTVVAKVDTMVQSTDMPDGMTLADAARKSVAACVSDFAAKGARPLHGIISLNIPRGTAISQVRQAARGLRQASQEFGVRILGGDTNGGAEFVFHVCVFGTADRLVPRGGAEPGDLLFATGSFGYAASGLCILRGKKASGRFKARALRAFCRPTPRLEFGIKCRDVFTSSMDSSDGLSATLSEMARQSGCRFVMDCPPGDGDIVKFAETNGLDADRMVFHGGEEYEIVFAAPEKHKKIIQRNARLTGTPVCQIGRVENGRGVFTERDGKKERLADLGWRHLA